MLIINILFALGYFLGGYLGTLISIPPSHASPIWPAAGIALAGVVTYGRSVIPGIWLGALITQIFAFSDTSNLENILFSLVIGGVASTAATTQAALGAWLSRRAIGLNNPLIDDGSILRFMALGGPVSCLISASAGIVTLYLQGIVTVENIPSGWITWWIGDTIGVLVFTPVLLCFIGEPRHLWRLRIIPVAVPLVLLSLLVLVLLHFGKLQEQTRISTLFEERSNLLHNVLKNELSRAVEINQNLKALFDSSNKVTAEEFKNFTETILKDHPNIQALEWMPRLMAENRSGYEPLPSPVFSIATPDYASSLNPAPADYFTIAYLEPRRGHDRQSDLSVLSASAIQEARDHAETTVSGLIRVVQTPDTQAGVVIYSPVYRQHQPLQTLEQRRQHLQFNFNVSSTKSRA